jgi:hypothetical protein
LQGGDWSDLKHSGPEPGSDADGWQGTGIYPIAAPDVNERCRILDFGCCQNIAKNRIFLVHKPFLMSDWEDRRARRADNQTKIFTNRVKYIFFFVTVTTGVLTIWDKCGWSARKPAAQVAVVRSSDSAAYTGTGVRRKEVAAPSHKRHGVGAAAKMDGGSGVDQVPQGVSKPPVTKPAPLAAPLERAVADNIEFRLMRAEGSSRAQTIKMTVVLITTAADWAIRHNVQSIIDDQGNEYAMKSYTNGASTFDSKIVLNTGVPIRCTFTFGGVLPSVGTIKLFKFQYWDPTTPGKVDWVEFRDIPVRWE